MTIEELIKAKLLVEIEPEKVSLVKSPANQRRFIFTKAADIEFEGSTDQTFDGTSIKVNGEELKGLESFNFSLVNWSDEEMEDWGATPVSMSWTIREASEDGLDKVEMFSLHSEVSKNMDKSDVLKAIEEDLGVKIPEAGFDKMTADMQKQLTNVAVFSKAFKGQPAFRDGVAHMVKEAIAEEPETPPEDPPETPPETPPATPPTDAEVAAQAIVADAARDAKIKALEAEVAALKKPAEGEEDEEDPAAAVTKADLAAVLEVVDGIAKSAGSKQSGEIEIEKAAGDPEDKWKSIKL